MAQNLGRTRAMTVRVLVVDDEPDVESLFRQQFRREVREGLYTLNFALSAVAALAILDSASGEKFILLVSDINMPGMSGLDLLPIVKTRRPNLPVFMIWPMATRIRWRRRWRVVLMNFSPSRWISRN